MTLHIDISPHDEARLIAAARQKGVDVPTYIKKLVTENLPPAEQNGNSDAGDFGGRSLKEVFGHLFGTVHGGPTDMAAHPEKYMEDFVPGPR